ITLLLLGLWGDRAYAPSAYQYQTLRVRLSAYSPKERGELSVNHKGKKIKNEIGFATRRPDIPDGTWIMLPNGEWKVKDDKTSRKYGNRIDVRYYESITARPKTRAVKRQLNKLDMGWDYIIVRKDG
ncbi:MAG: hypothetical protein QME51_10570, partial [Planctomycetota bacterium]|nr:hypothetical protein [Planctomycetota bacterium]